MLKLRKMKLTLSSLLNVLFTIIKNVIKTIITIKIILSRFVMSKIRASIIL